MSLILAYICAMSKSKKAAEKPAEGNKFNQALATLVKLAQANKAKYAKLNKGNVILVCLLATGLISFHFSLGSMQLAALYAFANDGVISGRQSNSVKTRNGIERRFVVPRLVRNAYTAAARALLSLFSSGWAGLTDSQRSSWNDVDNVFKSNRLGQSITIKGKQLFVQRNTNLLNAGVGSITDYLPSEGVAGSILTDGTVGTTTGAITSANIVFATSPTDATVETLVYATAPLPAGVSRPKNSAYRLITVMPNGSTTPFNLLTAYTTKYGTAATIGQKIGFRLIPIDNTTGQAGVISDFVVAVS